MYKVIGKSKVGKGMSKRINSAKKPSRGKKSKSKKSSLEDHKEILLTNLKSTIIEFIESIEAFFEDPNDQMDLMKVNLYFKNMSEIDLMNKIISHIIPHKEKVRVRDENYILSEKDSLFSEFPRDKVEKIHRLVRLPAEKGGLSSEDRIAVWQYFDVMIELGEQYKKHN